MVATLVGIDPRRQDLHGVLVKQGSLMRPIL
jgi:hypothetical protein